MPANKPETPSETTEAISTICRGFGVYLLEIVVRGSLPKHLILEIIIDSEKGISHEDCRSVSKALDKIIEHDSFLSSIATFEVLSPGVDRPLSEPWQFPKHKGRLLKISTLSGEIITGILHKTIESGIVLAPQTHGRKTLKQPAENTERTIYYSDISSAVVLIKF